ncbi:MAG TPA: M48 family metalloprotease [Burkholderiales bacterium]|nr:M48 family metalloprotease [Burkholderiales bacterium]
MLLFLLGFINAFLITPIIYYLLKHFAILELNILFPQLKLSLFSIKIIAFTISSTVILYLYYLSRHSALWLYYAISKCKYRYPAPQEQEKILFIKEQLNLRYNQINWGKIIFLMKDDDIINGYALGNNLIILTTGCFKGLVPPEEIFAIVAHELGHIYDKKTINKTSEIYMNRVFQPFIINPFESNKKKIEVNRINNYMILAYLAASIFFYGMTTTIIVFIIRHIVQVLLAKQNRDNEFIADDFIKKFNLQEYQCRYLNRFTEKKVKVSYKNLFKTHPSPKKRIQRLLQN